MQALAAALLLLVIAGGANWVAKRVVLRLFMRVLAHTSIAIEAAQLGTVIARLSNALPALVIWAGVAAIPRLPGWALTLVRNLSSAFIVLTFTVALSGALSLANDLYARRPHAANRPIKGYVQLGKLIIYGIGAIFVIAALVDRSPLLLLSGLGALAAVLMLVFKDTILSLVASVQIGSNDMVRVGDWIEMPQLNADGDVIDIALHVVKVQNFDKTITTIPTYRLITESFKNWRGMAESGARRIMRPIILDQNSVRFLSDDEASALGRISLIESYLEGKLAEIATWNRERDSIDLVNARRITNIGTFRAYVLAYLERRPDIANDKPLLVRQLALGEYGIPLEIYAFTKTTVWAEYEAIQADIFDHLLAILPEFGLRLFQRPTGRDLAVSSSATGGNVLSQSHA